MSLTSSMTTANRSTQTEKAWKIPITLSQQQWYLEIVGAEKKATSHGAATSVTSQKQTTDATQNKGQNNIFCQLVLLNFFCPWTIG